MGRQKFISNVEGVGRELTLRINSYGIWSCKDVSDISQLLKVRGIGKVLAKRILKYCNKSTGKKSTNNRVKKDREWEFTACVLSKAMHNISNIWSKLHSTCGIMLYPELSKKEYNTYCQLPKDRIQELSVHLVKRLKRMNVSSKEFQKFVKVRSCGGFVGHIVE